MRRIAIAAVLIVVSTVLWIGNPPMASAADFVCNEPTVPTGTVTGNVTVPAGGVCHLNGHTINGSVYVANDGKLFVRSGTLIKGSIVATQPQQLNVQDGSQINGSLTASGPGDSDDFGGFACGALIKGSVVLQNLAQSSASWIIGEPTSGGVDPPVYRNSDDPDLNCTSPNTINGSVTFTNNNVARLKLKANTINGSVTVNNNTVFNEVLRIAGNTIKGSLDCAGNNWTNGGPPEVTDGGEDNSVGGSATGQCAGF